MRGKHNILVFKKLPNEDEESFVKTSYTEKQQIKNFKKGADAR